MRLKDCSLPRIPVGLVVLSTCAVSLVGLSGPLFPFEPQPSEVAKVVAGSPDLDSYLQTRELEHAQLRPALAKGVLWNDPALRKKTRLSIVYLHGFSASRKDISPVVETLATTLNANAFFTRLTAHGLSTGTEFATVTPQAWLNDAREALAIGRRLGERVILIGNSTGGLLATLVALEENSQDIAALVLLSPNFGVRDWRAQFIAGPAGRILARVLIGKEYSFPPDNAQHGEIWTTRFPSEGIVALMDLVNYAASVSLRELKIPTLFVYTDKDIVVDVGAIRSRFTEIRDRRKRIVDLAEATRHELTGNVLAPDTVALVLKVIIDFLSDSRALATPRDVGNR